MGAIEQHTSYKAYARCVPDRLISGLLTVNIRNAYDNTDNKMDTNASYYYKWGDAPAASQNSYPYAATRPPVPATSREDLNQSFGDFDCFLFWVSGGMTLSSSLVYGNTHSTSGYNTDDGTTWYESITDPKCNSYIRSQLIGRSNNAYGHAATYFQKGIHNMKSLADAENDNLNNSQTTYLGDGYHEEYVMNSTTYSDSHDSNDNKWNLQTVANNTFYSPVRQISISGSHRFNTTTNVHATAPSGVGGSPNPTLYQLANHDSSFYSIVVDILLLGYHSSGASGGTGKVADKIRTDYNINVFFQPFGETPNLDFSTTEWAA